MAMYCNQFEFNESSDEFILAAEPPESFAMYPNDPGPPGPPGPAGPGVAEGGTTGQLLAKASDEDFDTEWIDPPELDAGHVTYDDTETYEDGTVGKEISDLKAALSTKADVIIDSVGPAAIASFPDGADNMPIREIAATIEPVQDLHGYANPWPPGGGKNKVPLTVAGIKSANSTRTWDANNSTTVNNVTFTILTDENGVVTGIKANGTASANATLYVFGNTTLSYGGYILNGGVADGSSSKWFIEYYDNTTGTSYRNYGSGDLTLSSDTNGHECRLVVSVRNGTQADNIVFKPMIRASGTDATFAPYSNICPISGWTGANGVQTAENLCSFNDGTVTSNGITFTKSNGIITCSGTATSATVLPSESFDVTPGDVLYLEGCPSGGSSSTYRLDIRDANGLISGLSYDTGSGYQFTVPSGVTSIRIGIRINTGTDASSLVFKPVVSFVFSRKTYLVTWQDEAGTVYRGSLNVTTGVLTATQRIYEPLDNAPSFVQGDGNVYIGNNAFIAMGYKHPIDTTKDISSHFVALAASSRTTPSFSISAQGYFAVNGLPGATDTVANWKAFLAAQRASGKPVQFLLTLATPIQYQLSPTEINTLLGQNNILFGCGQTSVTYPADTKLYIDKRIAALTA